MPDDTSHAADAERLREISRVNMHLWHLSPTDEPESLFLLRLLGARVAELREARAEIERIRKVGARIAVDKALARAEVRRLRAVAEAAQRVNDEYEEDVPMRSMPPLRKALAALPAAEPDEWRADRSGWYWVKRSFEEDTWRPAHWIVTPECTGWEGYTHPEEIVEIGRYIPALPAVSEESEQ